MRQVIVYPGEDGYWVVECPSLPRGTEKGTGYFKKSLVNTF